MTFIVHACLQQKKIEHLHSQSITSGAERTFMGEPRLWIKNARWPETIAALKVMVDVTKKLRAELA